MEFISEPTNTQYQQVTVDVPEDRVAEFHAFFARFLAGPGRRGRHGRGHHRGEGHGRDCGRRQRATEGGEATEQQTQTTEPTQL